MEPKPQNTDDRRDEPRPNPHAKSFTEIIREIDRGRVLPEIEEALQDVTHAVLATGKKGKLRIDLELKSAGENQLMLKAHVTPTIPKADPNPTLYFADDDRRLMRRDPRQYEMDLAPVTPKPIRPEGE